MTTVVLACGETPIPRQLSALHVHALDTVPGRGDLDPLIATAERIVVVGEDAALAAVVTRLMRRERLEAEVAYVTPKKTAATAGYSLPTGDRAARLAVAGDATEVPLIRDDTGVAVVGRAVVAGPPGGELFGEAYVDDERLFLGPVGGIEIRPTVELPGLRASVIRGRLVPRRWLSGRAIQLGAHGLTLTRDGIPHARTVKRSTFYRHTEPLRLVRATM
ncbi:hypothetical protein [Hoyosella subflava]|uniref:Peptidase M50 n=1 Tax=Hoyosella subflava (strain DSM 45089 / JCM 17490 / NBRC 109087 / DQS3-9A1) TaxID=443218 RepID=F6EIN8_HOYSD|nr:hypothetical protein AS9A_0506 [Hoyosella subflava DQS3-9A1]